MRKLSDAGLRVSLGGATTRPVSTTSCAAARTSHGTFYLYFANKEDLLRAARRRMRRGDRGPRRAHARRRPGPDGQVALRTFLGEFLDTYGHYGVVIRAWMENQVTDRKVDKLGVRAFTRVAHSFAQQLQAAGAPSDEATVASLMAMLERTSYAMTSRDLGLDRDSALDTLSRVIHRGFFAAA